MGVDKMLQFDLMGKGLPGKLSCMRTGLVIYLVDRNLQNTKQLMKF